MNSVLIALKAEILKVRKSVVFPGTIVFFLLVASMMGLVMFVQINPGLTGKLGMMGTKAAFLRIGEPTWPNYFKLLIQGFSAVGLIGAGFAASWTFGREFSDHTVKDILVVPVSRDAIVLAKSIVIIIWTLILSLVFFCSSFIIGILIKLPGLSMNCTMDFLHIYTVTTILMLPLFSPAAFFAGVGRGYILPLGFVILTLLLANFSGLVGLGPYFPWAIPGLYGIPTGDESMQLNPASYFILVLTGLTGLFATLIWWRKADHK